MPPFIFALLLFLISICAGVFGAILGLGGGIIIVPALTLLFKIPIEYAIGASIISIIATSSGAAASYVRDHITNIRIAMLLEVATTLGASAGVFFSPYISTRYLFLLFSLLMVCSAVTMLRQRRSELLLPEKSDVWARRLRLTSSYPDKSSGGEIVYGVTGVRLAFALMLGAGLLSALLGIGSGVLKVPAMDSAMHLPIKVSSATSNFMIGVTAATSAGAYYMRGSILPLVAGPVALGVLLGSFLGAKVMLYLKGVWIRRLFVVVLLIVAVQMGLQFYETRS